MNRNANVRKAAVLWDVTVRPNGARHFRRNGVTLGYRNGGFERV